MVSFSSSATLDSIVGTQGSPLAQIGKCIPLLTKASTTYLHYCNSPSIAENVVEDSDNFLVSSKWDLCPLSMLFCRRVTYQLKSLALAVGSIGSVGSVGSVGTGTVGSIIHRSSNPNTGGAAPTVRTNREFLIERYQLKVRPSQPPFRGFATCHI